MPTMQQCLSEALALDVFARPVHQSSYVYSYVRMGNKNLVNIHGGDRNGVLRGDFWRTMSQAEIEDEWIVCDQDGKAHVAGAKRRQNISDLLSA